MKIVHELNINDPHVIEIFQHFNNGSIKDLHNHYSKLGLK